MSTQIVPPGPFSLPLLGVIPQLIRNPLGTFESMHKNHGGFVRFKKGRSFRYICFDPEGINHILVANHKNYTKSKRYEKLKTFLGAGLVTTEGSQWQSLRKIAQTGFAPPALKDYFQTIQNVTTASMQRIEKKQEIELQSQMIEWTLSIISQTMFHLDLASQTEVLSPAFEYCVSFMNHRMESFIDWDEHYTTARGQKFNSYKKLIDQILSQIILERRNNLGIHHDYLENLLIEQTKNPQEVSDQVIKDQLITFIMAGHETSANMLTWTVLLLLKNPGKLKSAVDFCRSVDVSQHADLSQLTLLENILKESMRLFPPVWMISRDSISPDTVLNFPIEGGSTINICPYVTQRSPKYWDNPLEFMPERFEGNFNKKAFLPFSSGPRSCIGSQLALMEGKWILYQLLKNFNISCDRIDLEPHVSVVLKPKASHKIVCTKA